MDLIDWMCFGLFKDSECDFKRSELLYSFIQNLAGVINIYYVTWPYTLTTPYWSHFVPNSNFYRILSGFHTTFATGVACRQRTLTPPDTWSRPFGTCICSTCWDQSFSELVVILPDYALRIFLSVFSILLSTRFWKVYWSHANGIKHDIHLRYIGA